MRLKPRKPGDLKHELGVIGFVLIGVVWALNEPGHYDFLLVAYFVALAFFLFRPLIGRSIRRF